MVTDTSTPTPTETSRRRPRPRARLQGRAAVISWLLGATLLVAVLSLGSVHQHHRVVAHVGLLACLVGCAVLPAAALQRAGGLWRIALACGLMGMAVAASFVGSVGRESTVGALADVALWSGAGLAAGALAGAAGRSRSLHWPWVVGIAGVACLAAAHVATEANAVLGLVRPVGSPARFWAPFVNPNHFGALMVMGFPVALGAAVGRGGLGRRLASGAAALLMAGAVVASGSGAAPLVLGLQGVVVGTWLWRPTALLGVVALPMAVPVAIRWATAHGGDASGSIAARLEFWGTSGRAWLSQPLLGVGAGAHGLAIGPFRHDVRFVMWEHAHNDLLEWVVETGLVGALAWIVALVALQPWRLGSSMLARRLALGLGGLGLLALFDFPLQIPALAMLAAVATAWIVVRRDVRGSAARVGALRVLLAMAAATQLPAAAWQLRTALADGAAERLAADPSDADAEGRLKRLAPWRSALGVAQVRREARDDVEAAASSAWQLAEANPRDVGVARLATKLLLHVGRDRDAVAMAERCVSLAPWDRRSWELRALAHTALDPADAYAAWGDAIATGVPGAMEAAWALLPQGLYWADALESAPVRVRKELGAFLLRKGEEEAAGLVFDALRLEQPTLVLRDAPTLLVRVGRVEEACDYMSGLANAHPSDAWVRRHHPGVLERCERWPEARDAWLLLWDVTGTGLGGAVRCEARQSGLEAAVTLWEHHVLLGHHISPADRVVLAGLYADHGRLGACRAELAALGVLPSGKLAKEARLVGARCEHGR